MTHVEVDPGSGSAALFWESNPFPRLIQAGMGVRISSAKLANATARLGALGVVSSVGLRHIITDEVRAGNAETIAIAKTFPIQRYVDELLAYAPGGSKFRSAVPMDTTNPAKADLPKRLSAICSFVEVMRAKQGHCGAVGINVMWKCSLTVLSSIYGAMLAGVDALLCGAGVPMELPDIVRRIRESRDLEYKPLHGTETHVSLKIAQDECGALIARFPAPRLIPILSNFAFPKRIVDIWAREFDGARPFAFVLENHAAGGHNAPPRNKTTFEEQDNVASYFDKVRDLGVPVYVAGAGSTRADMEHWIGRGAYGLQVGSRFALCRESGMREDLRLAVIEHNINRDSEVATSSRLSSTGYPFKYIHIPGTLSEQEVYDARTRICNKGYLLQSHFADQPDGSVSETYICPGMPEKQYVKLGGAAQDVQGRACLCNALLATAGLNSDDEPALITLGESGTQSEADVSAREIVEEIMTPAYVAEMERKLTVPA